MKLGKKKKQRKAIWSRSLFSLRFYSIFGGGAAVFDVGRKDEKKCR
jgi:hypothetical protein